MREYFFQVVKSLILERGIGKTITRSELIQQGVDYYKAADGRRGINSSLHTCPDLVIRCFKRAKILRTCGRGEYEIISKIPDNIARWSNLVAVYNIQFPRYDKNRKRKSSRT